MIASPVHAAGSVITADELVRDLKHLPSAPKVLPRLKRLLSDANSSMSDVVSLIRLDQGIAARVLQVGNSAYYSQGVRCFTVDEAVNRVGYDQIYDLVSYAVASQVLVRPLVVYGIEADDLWKLSVATALAAELLAEKSGQDRDVAYTVGLLHSLGMVAIDDWALHHQADIRIETRGFPADGSADERAVFGFTQAETGSALLRLWDFPSSMCDPVQWQNEPRCSATQTRMSCLLHCAKWLRVQVCSGSRSTEALPAESIREMVPVRTGELPQLVSELELRLRQVSSLLEIDEQPRTRTSHRFPVANPAWSPVR